MVHVACIVGRWSSPVFSFWRVDIHWHVYWSEFMILKRTAGALIFPWAKMVVCIYRVIHVWDVHILNTPPSCIVHFLWTCYDSKLFASDALPVANIWPKLFMCFSHVSLFTGFVHKSDTFCFVPTAAIFSSFFATLSWIQRYLVCTCRSFPSPLLLAVPLAAEESLATTKSICNPQSRYSACTLSPNAQALTSA